MSSTPTMKEIIEHRIRVFNSLTELPATTTASTINVTVGNETLRVNANTTPLALCKNKKAVVALVNNEPYDLTRPLNTDCTLSFLTFEDERGKEVFWHSSAHVLGCAIESLFECSLSNGPPTQDGFFYECFLKDKTFSPDDYRAVEERCAALVREAHDFVRKDATKEELLELFKHNAYKLHFIQQFVTDRSTVYRCGDFIDFCRGPHVRSTSVLGHFRVVTNSSSYFLGSAENDSLQRLYAVSFPTRELLLEHDRLSKIALERDHRRIGLQQKLFFFDEVSPGSAFFLPHGAVVYARLQDYLRGEYRKRGFTEVLTPNVFSTKLWETSGHWAVYKENMFCFDVEGVPFALKPMNCPGHCVMFGHEERSYRELPLRFADFGVLHRNELSGTLTGLQRVRRFQQDDAHIFCTEEQVGSEVAACLDFVRTVYGRLGLSYTLALSTRPEKFVGSVETWNRAEERLRECLRESGLDYRINEGDGAFYGPKIDISILDVRRRRTQCATIQLDFQLPEKFGLRFVDNTGARVRPVMVHRAVLGSIERMISILCEEYAGRWPFWLSPRQVLVASTASAFSEYANRVYQILKDAGFSVELNDSRDSLTKKIKVARNERFNYAVVVGEKEESSESVSITELRGNVPSEVLSLSALCSFLKSKE